MLKIYYNEKSDAIRKIHITIRGDYCSVTTEDNNSYGTDVIGSMASYHSYALTEATGLVKIYRKVSRSDYKWLDLNRLGVSIKMDFADICELYGNGSAIQVDTGMISEDTKDIVVRIFQGQKDSITIDADQDYELLPFNSDDLVLGKHPRMELWDSYSLSAQGHEWKADRKGFVIDGDFDEVLIPEDGYIEFTITKYKGDFSSGEKLERDIDDDEVLVDASAGLVNNRRVQLENGVGTFRLYPFGHEGLIKIKLGRKWYEVWNDYLLVIGGEE